MLILVVGLAAWLGSRVLQAKNELEAAQSKIGDLTSQAAALDIDGALATFDEISAHTDRAVDASSDPTWRVAELVPGVGVNLSAVRELSVAVQRILADVASPLLDVAKGLDLQSLAPKDGAIDLQPLVDAVPAVAQARRGLDAAIPLVGAINTDGALPQIVAARSKVAGMVEQLDPLLTGANSAVPFIAPMLGSEGPRNYVVMFQNPSEARPLGGTALSFAVIRVDQGRIEMVETVPAGFGNFRNVGSVVPVPEGVEELFGPGAFGSFIANSTLRPSFTSAAEITQANWVRDRGYAVDGVVSIDPIALGYVLRATGPIPLSTGDVLASDTLVPLLLNEIYQRFNSGNDVADNRAQDVVYGEAVAATFGALTGGSLDPVALVGALVQGWGEHRILFWSANENERSVVALLGPNGELPVSDAETDRVGLYFNDNVGSKLNYYLNQAVTLSKNTCAADGRQQYRVTADLSSTLQPGDAAGLSPSVAGQWKGERVPKGSMRMQVFLYAPPGSTITGAVVNGQSVALEAHHDTDYPVGKLTVIVGPGESLRLSYDITAAEAGDKSLEVLTTPLVHPTLITTEALDCATVSVG
ncbi:hypothetical protein C2138_11800 [Salinibacterium hongtaonis]|nr:hypothetical protein C2138_11800 [Salinibacterium hongtaonis]